MKKSILSLLGWSLPFLLLAQNNASNLRQGSGQDQRNAVKKGIQWTTELSWEQVKQKAKAENKFIFLDVYATWCGPCKQMDKNVYTADSVGEFYNKNFISVKVQMDKTKKDDETVKKWYADADSINKMYHIEGYPTLLFFNPNGQITEHKLGYKGVAELVALGKAATAPGKIYDDPYADYNRKIAAYKGGERNYDYYPAMIRIADKIRDTLISKQLTKELTDYVVSLPPKERYIKERIEFWNSYSWSSLSRAFGFFYKDAKLINKIMKRKGYAENFIDRTIQHEIVLPFLEEQAKESGIPMRGMYLNGPGLKADSNEADWGKLDSIIETKYGKDYAIRNVLAARIEWYNRHRNIESRIKYALILLNKYAPDLKNGRVRSDINYHAWDAFLLSNDKRLLQGYKKWMKKVVKERAFYTLVDTYAQLLYKLGSRKKAIQIQEKAAKLAPEDQSILRTLQQMKNGEPTYLDQGAIWKKVK